MKGTYEFCALITTTFRCHKPSQALCTKMLLIIMSFSMFSFSLKTHVKRPPMASGYTDRRDREEMASVCILLCRRGGRRGGDKGREGHKAEPRGSLTCSHSTAHSGRVRTRRSSLEECWGSAHRLPRACRGSGDTHPHTFFQSTLWRQDQDHLHVNVSPASHAS
jgi:hypothetical protein